MVFGTSPNSCFYRSDVALVGYRFRWGVCDVTFPCSISVWRNCYYHMLICHQANLERTKTPILSLPSGSISAEILKDNCPSPKTYTSNYWESGSHVAPHCQVPSTSRIIAQREQPQRPAPPIQQSTSICTSGSRRRKDELLSHPC